MDYADLYQKTKLFEMSPETLLSLCFLTAARMMPIIGLAPFFGARILPHAVKLFLCICLMIMVLPKVMLGVTGPLPFNITLMTLLFKELFIGTILGFFLCLPFLIVSSAGVLIDHQRGAASLMTNDPTVQNQSSPMGTLFNYVLIVLFYASDGPFYVIDTVFASYDLVPPDKFLNPLFFLPESPLRIRIDQSLQVFFELALQFAMPGLLIILMTDTFLGIINRMAPQVQITFLGMGFKSWLAILIVAIGWSPICDQMTKQIIIWLREFHRLIQELAIGQVS
jgi:type III secretion protein T